MECYEGAEMIKSFRGLLGDGAQDTILLHTNKGEMGYRIVKFQLIGIDCSEDMETTVKIFKTDQTVGTLTITADINFSDNTMLAAAIWSQHSDAHGSPEDLSVIFDQEIFNQDIYVTNKGVTYTKSINYYIELEQFKLNLDESTVATLKDVRNTALPAQI